MHQRSKTDSDIDNYGLSVIMIEATDYLPSFAYSIGLWKTYNHPELICFGLNIQALHTIINDVSIMIKGGGRVEMNRDNHEIFENGRAQFLQVDSRNVTDYFGQAINYYGACDFPALQLVWTDRGNKFPWEDNFEQELLYRQPLLDRNADFKFREPCNLATFTTQQWMDLQKPILRVVHEKDGDWQFLTGEQTAEDIRLIALEELVCKDGTLNDVFDLDYGEAAERDFLGGKWIRFKLSDDENEEDIN